MEKVTKDGRTILKGRAYTDNKLKVWVEQGEKCLDCGRHVEFKESHFHHDKGRGMNGSKRDDLDPANKVLCPPCHEKYTPQPQWSRREIES